MEEDAADIKARKAREAEAARLAAERKKSQVRRQQAKGMTLELWLWWGGVGVAGERGEGRRKGREASEPGGCVWGCAVSSSCELAAPLISRAGTHAPCFTPCPARSQCLTASPSSFLLCPGAPVVACLPATLPPSPQTLQRGLPRPVSIDKLPPPKAPSELEALSLRERAEAELLNELAALVQHDNITHPPASDADAAGVLCLGVCGAGGGGGGVGATDSAC